MAWSICAWLSTKPLSCTEPLLVATAISSALTLGSASSADFTLAVTMPSSTLLPTVTLPSLSVTPFSTGHALHRARHVDRAVDLRLAVREPAQLDDALAGFDLELQPLDLRSATSADLTLVVTTVSSILVPTVVFVEAAAVSVVTVPVAGAGAGVTATGVVAVVVDKVVADGSVVTVAGGTVPAGEVVVVMVVVVVEPSGDTATPVACTAGAGVTTAPLRRAA